MANVTQALKDRIQAQLDRMRAAMPPVTEDELERWRRERDEEYWRGHREVMGVPQKYWEATLQSDLHTDALQRAIEFMNDGFRQGQLLCLMGTAGAGKTYAAVGALRAATKVKRRFFDTEAMCVELIAGNDDGETYHKARTTFFAVFDDFGSQYVKEAGSLEMKLESIFRAREANNLPTILTSNLSSEDFMQRISGRMKSRIFGTWGKGFNCHGKDLRVKA